MNKTEKGLKGFEGRINGMFGGVAKGLGINLGALTKVGLIVAATKALYSFGKQAVAVASDLREVQNVVDTTFGSMSNEVNEFASNSIKSHGLSELAAKQYTSTMGAMLKSSGITGEAVRDMSIEMTKLTADVASFYNLSGDAAFQKIRAGISGENEPLKALGVNMSVANMEAYAMAQGINTAWREMTQAEQTMLRYNYLLSVTGDAQGDFAKESQTWANQVKILKEQWKEFMGLIGTALIEVLLPVVKGLNKMLEVLINVTKEIGKIYTMITGREVAVESTNSLADANTSVADTAEDAAGSQGDLGKGIDKAAKAAKKALAPFDELNILQNNLSSGGGGGGSGGLFDGLSSGGTGIINTTMTTKQVDEAPDRSKWDAFFIWLGDKWNGLKQAFAVPIMVPAPAFATIPSPIYNPNWGLVPPFVYAPGFEPIPNPVYKPVWGLEIPKVGQPAFQPIPNPIYNPNWNLDYPTLQPLKIPALDLSQYNLSLENIKKNLGETKTVLEKTMSELNKRLEEETSKTSKKIEDGLSKSWATVETNYEKHKVNVGAIALGVSTVLVANINQGLSRLGTNINNTVTTAQNNLQTFGRNAGAIAGETARAWSNNLKEGLSTAHQNTVNFAKSSGSALKSFGEGMLSVSASAAKGFVSNIVSGLSTAWSNFKEAASAMGERVSGWFSENKKVITTTAIVAGVALAGAGLVLAAPTVIPYAAAALGGLASVPALAKGGITNGPTLAMVGDNPGGKEVVSPLDGLLDMIVEAVNTTNNNNGGDTTIIVKIGEDTITEKVVSNINRSSRINGKTVVEV